MPDATTTTGETQTPSLTELFSRIMCLAVAQDGTHDTASAALLEIEDLAMAGMREFVTF